MQAASQTLQAKQSYVQLTPSEAIILLYLANHRRIDYLGFFERFKISGWTIQNRLSTLKKKGLIMRDGDGKKVKYWITEKGMRVLKELTSFLGDGSD